MRSFLLFAAYLLCTNALLAQIVFQNYDVAPDVTWNLRSCGMAAYQNKLFFGGSDATHPAQLWKCDGTLNGTQRVVSPPASLPSRPTGWIDYKGKMLFAGIDTGGSQLWITDGSSAGTHIVKYIPTLSYNYYHILYLTAFNNKVFFTCSSRLWSTDGTAAGTQPFGEVFTGSSNMIVYNNKLYFVGHDAAHGYELWSTDGTDANTKMLIDINPGKDNGVVSGSMGYMLSFVEYNGKLYFGADDSVHGAELWVTDGSASGTHMVKDITPGKNGTQLLYPVIYKNLMYFSADSEAYASQQFFSVLTSDGTEAGTKYFIPSANSGPGIPIAVYKDMIYFRNGPNMKPALFRSDGTPSGTSIVKNVRGVEVALDNGNFNSLLYIYAHNENICSIQPMAEYAGRLYFYGHIDTADVLISTDGTDAGTTAIAPPGINPDNFESPTSFIKVNNKLYFGGQFGTNPYQLWSIYDSAGVAGIEHVTDQSFCNLYPNPSHNNVNIHFNSIQRNIDINLTDLNGRIIQRSHFTASANVQLDVRAMNTGLYFINVIADDKKQSLKFIKE